MDDGSTPTHLRDANSVGQKNYEAAFLRDNVILARRVGVPFSFATFLLGKQKKSR